jgi:hypothetical protein
VLAVRCATRRSAEPERHITGVLPAIRKLFRRAHKGNCTYDSESIGLDKLSSSLLGGAAYEKGTARGAFDFQEPYLLHILAFIGLTDVTFIHAENQAREEADVFFFSRCRRYQQNRH